MLVDLHTHTTASDGTLTPQQLLAAATTAGIDVLSITDHDSVAAYSQLPAATGLELVTGIEVSALWAGRSVHVVGLNVDVHALEDVVRRQTLARERRAERIVERLARRGLDVDLAGIRERAAGAAIGRPHIAAELVAQGIVRDVRTAFRKHLGPGKAGDIKTEWPDLDTAVGWLRAANGTAVIAHPLRYRLTRTALARLAADFRAAGGQAVELVSGHAAEHEVAKIADLAAGFGFRVSVGSDFHAPLAWRSLGVDSARLRRLKPVWDGW